MILVQHCVGKGHGAGWHGIEQDGLGLNLDWTGKGKGEMARTEWMSETTWGLTALFLEREGG